MDIISMILAQNKGGEPLAKTEKKILTHDGNNDGKDIFSKDGYGYCRIGDSIDPKTITEITMLYLGNNLVLTANELVITELNDVIITVSMQEGVPGVYIFPYGIDNLPAGTYVLSIKDGANSYVTRIVTETIHPIPDWAIPQIPAEKLPGAVLPVVELTTELANGAVLTETESEALTSATKSDTPVIIKVVTDGFSTTAVAHRMENAEMVALTFNGLDKLYGFAYLRGGSNWVVNTN